MKKKDIKYRQGRSKAQVESNGKVLCASTVFFGSILIITIIVNFINKIL